MNVHGFNENGMVVVEIDGVEWVVPDDMGNSTRQLVAEWEGEGNTIPPYVPPVSPPYSIYKTTLWVRLTDAEAETVMAAKNQQPAKFRGIWDDALTIQSDSEFFGVLKSFLTAALSAKRAGELLQPEA